MLAYKGIFARPSISSTACKGRQKLRFWVLRSKTTSILYYVCAMFASKMGKFSGHDA